LPVGRVLREVLNSWARGVSEPIRQGYWLDGEWPSRNDDTSKACERPMCGPCVERAHRLLLRLRGEDWCDRTVHIAECWAGTERPEWCRACGVLLYCGGFLRYGVEDALGVDEPGVDDFTPCSSPGVYIIAADSMVADDPRWGRWERQVWALHAQTALVLVEVPS
jgi:hypothetical protein